MSTLCKAFSTIINQRLVLYLEINNIFVDEQNGFRRMRSCLDHIFVLCTLIRNRKQQGLSTYCCFIDFEKAFDSVYYPYLWHKMLAYGIHGHILNIIRTLYTNLESCVRIHGRLTDWFSQTSGVRQGDTLAPTLFAIFINDLALEINALSCGVTIGDGEQVSILLFADDIVLISDTEDGLKSMMKTAGEWSRDWRLKINYTKTKVTHFRKAATPPTSMVFDIDGHDIDIASSYKYLGFDMCDTLDYTHAVKTLNSAASRALGMVTAKYFALDGISHSVYKHMYDSLVCPIMDYGTEVWGTKVYDCCNTTQHRAMRTFLGVGKCAPLPALYGDLQWTSVTTRHQMAVVRYWGRLTRLPRSRLTKRVFEWDYEIALRGRRSWNKEVKSILARCDHADLFERENWARQSPGGLARLVGQHLTRLEHVQRAEAATTMSRLAVYNGINPDMDTQGPAPYVGDIRDRHLRSQIANLRTGTLPLAIETGRYVQRPVHERLCRQCEGTDHIETELHFIFECAKYDTLRETYDIGARDTDSMDQLKTIFQDTDKTKTLSRYIIEALTLRRR